MDLKPGATGNKRTGKRSAMNKRGRANTILAIGSHPDDIEFGCGGTLARFAGEGYRVYALVMTSGARGGLASTRHREQIKAAATLGIREVFWGAFEDTRLPFYDNVTQGIEKIVQQVKPTFVLVHHGKDTHQDHRHVSSCAVVASRNIPNVLFYEGPTTFDFAPNVYMDIHDHMKTKFRSLSFHRSQVMKTNVEQQSIIDIAKATATFRGTQCRIPFAEAFMSLRMILTP